MLGAFFEIWHFFIYAVPFFDGAHLLLEYAQDILGAYFANCAIMGSLTAEELTMSTAGKY